MSRFTLDTLKHLAHVLPALLLLFIAAASARAGDTEAERNARDRARLAQVTEQWRSAEKEAASLRQTALTEARANGGKPSLRTESALASALEKADRTYDHIEELAIRLGAPLPNRATVLSSTTSSNDALAPLVARARADIARAFRLEARNIARKLHLPSPLPGRQASQPTAREGNAAQQGVAAR